MKFVPNSLFTMSLIFHFSFFIFHFPTAYAEITKNDNWTIEVKEVNITSNTKANNKNEQATENQPSPLQSPNPLSLSISNDIIDYGPLSPTNQIYRTSNLNISTSNKKGFIVIAYENHPLITTGLNSFIPDSTCDNGSCSEVTSAIWINTLTYGFGYRCDNVSGNDCPIGFNQDDYYKQFSDSSKNEIGQVITSSNLPEANHESQITYKLNISKTQPAGSYNNTITYIAVPGY